VGSEKVRSLADSILGLTVLEASQLSEILRERLNIQKPAFGGMAMPMMMAGAPAAAPAGGGDAAAAAPAEEKKEKTEFNVKLESFAAEAKIKVIKEIRAITNLGLKEAKELVSSRASRCSNAQLLRGLHVVVPACPARRLACCEFAVRTRCTCTSCTCWNVLMMCTGAV
jgi:large subunit ribosomal protein L7/L12